MKILLANVSTAPENEPFITDVLVPVWTRNLKKTASPDTEFVFRFPEWGIEGIEGNFFHSIQAVGDQLLFHMCKDAEDEGFDAVIITCFADPFLEHLRQFLNIPVVGIGESAFSLAAKMGRRFGVVTISPYNVFETWQKIEEYGLKEKCAGVVSTRETPEEQPAALVNANTCIKSFSVCGRELIKLGAEVLIPGCGLMAPGVRLAPGCEKEYPDGFMELDGAAVVDVFGAAVLDAEGFIRLKNSGAGWIGRNGWYARPTAGALKSGKMCFYDERMKFWDISV